MLHLSSDERNRLYDEIANSLATGDNAVTETTPKSNDAEALQTSACLLSSLLPQFEEQRVRVQSDDERKESNIKEEMERYKSLAPCPMSADPLCW